MRLISAWEQLTTPLAERNHNIVKSFTNFFPDQDQFQIFLNEGRISLHDTASVLWILRQDRGFSHLYYSCHSPDDLVREFDQVLPFLAANTTVTIIAREGYFGKSDEVFLPLGFERYSEFRRLTLSIRKITTADISNILRVSNALEADARKIEKLYLDSFDPLDDEIPSLREISNYIRRQQAKVVRINTDLGACLITRAKGKTSHFLYIAVHNGFQGQGLASALMRYYLHRCAEKGIQRSLLWVRNNNENALAYYRHFDYTEDGLHKRIYLIRK